MVENLLREIREVAVAAGREAMRFYGRPLPVDYKADDSPLTAADRAAHRLICERLRQLTPEIPVLSEESEPAEVAGRRGWKKFWLVDPLDGTKEFIKQTGEFTVNIALIVDGEARLGVVHAPAAGLTYFAEKPHGAFKQTGEQPPQSIQTRPSPLRNQEPGTPNQEPRTPPQAPSTKNQEPHNRLTIVASRDHAGPMVKKLFGRFPEAGTKSMGSSLKFCLVAEGAADLYLRDAPTMEWDTAAAQCILEAAGGEVRDLDGARLTYNREDQKNPPFIALGDPSVPF